SSISGMNDEDWHETELLAITDRNNTKGALLIAPDDIVHAAAYEISRGIANKQTGRAQPIICDFCRTWQTGSNAGRITFQKDTRSLHSISFLCCADLKCSQHVRDKTNASHTSRAQLREDLTSEQRVTRLKERLRQILIDLSLEPINV